jgi:hypothetical protein
MFDGIIYKTLNKIIELIERYKAYRIRKSLPKSAYNEQAKSKSLKKWVKQNENSYK